MSIFAKRLLNKNFLLAENIIWDHRRSLLLWTDINGNSFNSCDEDGSNYRKIDLNERLCSFALTINNKIIAAFEKQIFLCDFNLNKLLKIADFELDDPDTRLNDGKCDYNGRFVVGGYNQKTHKKTTKIISIDTHKNINVLIKNIGCTNSIEFSNCKKYIYHSDSLEKYIYRSKYDYKNSRIYETKPFIKYKKNEGFPDGSCIDKNNNIWNSQYDGGCVQQINQNSELGIKVNVPCPQVTCACFGGKNLDTLFISTAQENYTYKMHKKFPFAGSIFYYKFQKSFEVKGMNSRFYDDN